MRMRIAMREGGAAVVAGNEDTGPGLGVVKGTETRRGERVKTARGPRNGLDATSLLLGLVVLPGAHGVEMILSPGVETRTVILDDTETRTGVNTRRRTETVDDIETRTGTRTTRRTRTVTDTNTNISVTVLALAQAVPTVRSPGALTATNLVLLRGTNAALHPSLAQTRLLTHLPYQGLHRQRGTLLLLLLSPLRAPNHRPHQTALPLSHPAHRLPLPLAVVVDHHLALPHLTTTYPPRWTNTLPNPTTPG